MKLLISALILLSAVSAKAFTIGAYNIRNFDYDERFKISTNKGELAKLIKSMKVDLLSVQEISNTAEWDKFVQTNLPGYDTEISRCGGRGNHRLGFLYNKSKVELLSFNEDLTIVDPPNAGSCDGSSRPMAVGLFRMKSTGQRFYGLTVHLKAGSDASAVQKRAMQFEIIRKTILELRTKTGVQDFYFAGDMNTTEFLARGSDYTTLNKLSRDLGMMLLTGNLKCTAYYWGGTDDGIETPTVLDHIIATPGLVKLKGSAAVKGHGHCEKVSCRQVPVKELGIIYESVSDHCPVTATIQ